jgi:hypothetical protein
VSDSPYDASKVPGGHGRRFGSAERHVVPSRYSPDQITFRRALAVAIATGATFPTAKELWDKVDEVFEEGQRRSV